MTAASPTLSLNGDALPHYSAPARNPAGVSPMRRPGSVRRTASIYLNWPDGPEGWTYLHSRARDIVTPLTGGAPIVIADDQMTAQAEQRMIWSVVAHPPRNGLEKLDGARAGGHLRDAIDQVLHEERVAGTPLYLLLDDMAGTTLIARWALSQWNDKQALAEYQGNRLQQIPSMEDVCIGFRPGSSALDTQHSDGRQIASAIVPPIVRADDPAGWHAFPALEGPNLRRVRRIDVWREDGVVQIDATFQDSGALPNGTRRGLHEYVIRATADAQGQALLSLESLPHILPYPECPAATVNIYALLGTPLTQMRTTVLAMLRKTAGCTHLNDALRALAEVPRLIALLPVA